MKGAQGFALFVNVAMNIILGIILTIVVDVSLEMRLGVRFITPEVVAGTALSSFCVGFTAGTLVPAMDWGAKLAGRLGLKPGGAGFYVCCAAMLGICMGICITFGNFLIAGLGAKGLSGALADVAFNIPVILVSAVILVVVFLKPVQTVAARVTGFDPLRVAA